MEKQTRNEATNTLIIQLNEMYHEAKAQDTPIGTYASISLNNESIFLVVSQTGHYYGSYVVDTDVVFTTSADSPRELTESLFDFREGYLTLMTQCGKKVSVSESEIETVSDIMGQMFLANEQEYYSK